MHDHAMPASETPKIPEDAAAVKKQPSPQSMDGSGQESSPVATVAPGREGRQNDMPAQGGIGDASASQALEMARTESEAEVETGNVKIMDDIFAGLSFG
jgi:hypothetical protein